MNILVIAAHPDDAEGIAGGTAALYRKNGHRVKFLSVTNGDTGHFAMGGAQLARRRKKEAENSASVIGAECTVFDIHNNELEPNLFYRKMLVEEIRKFKTDIIITHRPYDYHPDHRYTGILVQDSSYMVTVPFFCPDVDPLDKNPVFLFSYDRFKSPNPFKPDVVVTIDEVIEKKVDALLKMESQFIEGGALGSADRAPKDEAAREKRRHAVRDSFKRRFAAVADNCRGSDMAVSVSEWKDRSEIVTRAKGIPLLTTQG